MTQGGAEQDENRLKDERQPSTRRATELRRRARRLQLVMMTVAVAATLASALPLLLDTIDPLPDFEIPRIKRGERFVQLNELERRLAKFRERVQHDLVQLSVEQPSRLTPRVRFLERRLSSSETRIGRLEGALRTTPAKALQLPLLQRDVEELRSVLLGEVDSVRNETQRQYGLMKWVLGTVGLGFAALIVTVAITGRQARAPRLSEPSRDAT